MSLTLLRAKIDELDLKVLHLLNKRAEIAAEIGRIKNNLNMSITHTEREQEILDRMIEKNTGPLSDNDLEKIYIEIIRACRDLQKER